MVSNHLTIIVQPDWYSSSKKINSIYRFSAPPRLLYSLSVGAVLLILFGICGSWHTSDNAAVKNRIASINHELAGLKKIETLVDDIRKEEKIIRQSLGMETLQMSFDINERLGIGGAPEAENDIGAPPLAVVPEIENILDERPLHVRVHDLREDVHELMDILSKRKETLKCRPTIMPVKDQTIWISSGYGWRKSPFTGLREFHKGLDISGRKGAKIVTTADGKVMKVGYNRFIGKYIKIDHDDRFATSYGHLWQQLVKEGDYVKRGQVIGYMGSTGMSTGYHLHYEVIDQQKKVNPYDFILNRNEITLASAHY